MRRRAVDLVRMLLLAALYVAAGRSGLLLDAANGIATLVWAPSGIALAALLVHGKRLWPGIALGALVINLWVGAAPVAAAGIAFGNTLAAVLGAYALSRLVDFRLSLDRMRDVLALTILGACACPLISATIGVSSLELAGALAPGRAAHLWVTWWWGDFAGMVIVAPLLLTWSLPSAAFLIARGPRRREIASLSISLLVVGASVWFNMLPPALDAFEWPFMVTPLLLWAAVRFGSRGAATATFVTSAFAISATALGEGPFVRTLLSTGLLPLQVFLSTTTLGVLSLGAVAIDRARAAAQAAAANRHKGAILEAAPDAVVTMDELGNVRTLNASAVRLFAFGPETAPGQELATLALASSQRARHRAALAAYLRTGDARLLPRRLPMQLVRGDATEFPGEVTIVPVPDEGEIGFTSFIRDLSAQRAAERELQRSREELEERVLARTTELRELNLDLAQREEQLRMAQTLAHVGSFAWDPDCDLLRCSDELYRIFGLAPRSPITYQAFLALVVDEDRERVRSLLRLHDPGRHRLEFEARITRSDRAIRTVRFELAVEVGESGRRVRMIGTGQDVTEQRLAEQVRARLSAIVESSADAIVGKTADGTIEDWNRGAERIFGYRAEEVVGKSVSVLTPPEYQGEMTRMLERIRNGERMVTFETQRLRKNGELFDVSVTMSPIFDAAERVIGVSSITHDITGRKRVEKAMSHSLREKEVLLRELHHRVKNNLQIVASLLNLQASRGGTDKEMRRGFEESESRIQSMALVHQLLYLSRDLVSIEFCTYLENLVGRLADSFGAASEPIDIAVSGPGVHLDIDTAIPCGLIVNELVSNCLQHAFPGGRSGHIEVSLVVHSDDRLRLTVADDGIGIPQESWDRPRTLGLQIVFTLAKQLDGTLELARDGGTAIQIDFPRQPAAAAGRAAPEPAPHPA